MWCLVLSKADGSSWFACLHKCACTLIQPHHTRATGDPLQGLHTLPLGCCARCAGSSSSDELQVRLADGTCVWALATMPQPEDADSDALPSSKLSDSSSAAGISCLLCFSVADGSLLQQLQQPHGASAVSHFCLDADSAVTALCWPNVELIT